jgi:ribonuclease HII
VRLGGVDEAGRGPLAGPVVAAAIYIPRDFLESQVHGQFAALTDSKKLTPKRRDEFFELLISNNAILHGIGMASSEEIDAINIRQATHLAMRRACNALADPVDHVLVDGLAVDGLPCPSTPIVKGDSLSLLIAAASILAKVTRDKLMVVYDSQYPDYGFAKHKGYGSKHHMEALMNHGPCPIHRQSFRPVREAALLREYVRDHQKE